MKRCFLLLSLVVLVAPCSRADEAIAHQESQTNDTVSAQTIYVPKAKVKAKKKTDRAKAKVKRKTKDIKSETKEKVRRKLYVPQATTNSNQSVVK